MTVKLASALPKDDKNGLTAIASDLVTKHRSKELTTAIVILKTAKITNDEEFQVIPETKIVRIEPITGDLEDEVLDLLQQATENRVGRKPDTLNFSNPGDEFADIDETAPLAIEAGIEDAEIVDEDPAPAPVTPLSPLVTVGGDAA